MQGQKHLTGILALLLLIFFAADACRKDDTPDITGEWQCMVCMNADQRWTFSRGDAVQEYSAAGQVVHTNRFHYWVKQDTVNFVNTATQAVTAWKVRFVGDAVLEVNELNAPISAINYLERCQ